MQILKSPPEAPPARHPDFDMVQETITVIARQFSAREEGEPSRREIGVAFGAILALVALFWLLAKVIGF